jgi:hypothetical protein
MEVKACYEFMPDDSCFDDKGIQNAMKNSCIILIALSHTYIKSGRFVE